MRKQTKIVAGLSAAALLAIGASMTSLAAAGWVNEGGSWYYANSNGDYVTDAWKSYNGQYFYLGGDGAMLTNELIEDGDNHYYVDANGAMVKNTWVAVPDDDNELDVEYRWYYFGSTGKAYRKSYNKTINGKKYGFDEDGKMLFGYVADGSYQILNGEDDPILGAMYYFGTNEDGARHSGWLQYTDALTDKDDDYYWFYFKSNGQKVSGQTKNINGKKYIFDTDGIMGYKWEDATIASVGGKKWFNAASDGSLAKNAWIWAVPAADMSQADNDSDTSRWFRTNASGNLIKDTTKKINGKWYVFDANGIMKKGLVKLTTAAVSGAKIDTVYDMDSVTLADITGAGSQLHYFSEDEEKDGSMKTGTIKISMGDDDRTFGFAKTTGAAYHGINNSKIYIDGVLQKAGDDKYKVVTNPTDSKYYLVGSTGNVVKSVSKYKDANDVWYVYLGVGQIGSTTDEEAAKTAVKNKSLAGLNTSF